MKNEKKGTKKKHQNAKNGEEPTRLGTLILHSPIFTFHLTCVTVPSASTRKSASGRSVSTA